MMVKINAFTRRELTADEVYAFPVILCDNEVDRDNECFSTKALYDLAKLFVGKTGIFDHNPKGENQTARIFDTAVVTCDDRKTVTGQPYAYIEAKAYILKSEKNADLIAEIDGGIKKEVSVSCSVEREICSVCHTDRRQKMCAHIKGNSYAGKKCHIVLDKPTDAYEFSFVAIPAQKNAGVTKSHNGCLIDDVVALYHECDTVLPQKVAEELLSKCGSDKLFRLKKELEGILSKRELPDQMARLLALKAKSKGSSPYSMKQ